MKLIATATLAIALIVTAITASPANAFPIKSFKSVTASSLGSGR